MSSLPALLSLLAVDLLAAASPGPNFFLVTQAAARRGRRYAAAVVAGFVAANLIWCLAALFGLSAIFSASPWLYRVVKIIGGGYLVYLGISVWRSSGVENVAGSEARPRSGFVRGALTNLSNPKSVAYFGSVFALFMGPDAPASVQAAAVAIVLFDTILWYGMVALAFSSERVQRRYAVSRQWINRAAGLVMAGFGLRMIADDN